MLQSEFQERGQGAVVRFRNLARHASQLRGDAKGDEGVVLLFHVSYKYIRFEYDARKIQLCRFLLNKRKLSACARSRLLYKCKHE
jgi:hypothetical protein